MQYRALRTMKHEETSSHRNEKKQSTQNKAHLDVDAVKVSAEMSVNV